MTKRWISILLVAMLLRAGCAQTPPQTSAGPTQTPAAEPSQPPSSTPAPLPSEEPSNSYDENCPELAELRQSAADSGALLAVAFLGYSELPDFEDIPPYLEANCFTELYPFLGAISEDMFARQEGGELYAVVPVSDDIQLTVYEYLMDLEDDYIPDAGKELLTVSGGEAILLIGNVSDIVPNLLITAEDGNGRRVEYAPCLSMENGQLTKADGIYDFTPTELLGQYYPGYDPLPDAIVCGTWWAQHYTADELMAVNLTLKPDGTAEYFYGYPYGDILESFEGTWYFTEDDQLELNLYGGPASTDGSGTNVEPHSLQGSFNWSTFSSALILEHADGSSLLDKTAGEVFRFLPFDGYRFIGDWVAEDTYWGWIYELRLFDNGDTWFNIYDEARELLVGYVGWWSVENDILNLSLILDYGQHPESPEIDYIWGHYFVHQDSPDELVLEFEEGSILTVNMEDGMQEAFIRWSIWYEQKYN